MSRNFVNLFGRLTADPELITLRNNVHKASFTVATNEAFVDPETGEARESSEFHFCVAYGRTATLIVEHFKKGDLIDVTGANKTRRFQDRDDENARRRITEVEVKRVNFSNNLIVLVGNVTRTPIVRQTADAYVANFDLAVSVGTRAGDNTPAAQFFRCVAFSPIARVIKDHVRSGTKLRLFGHGQTRKWRDEHQNDRYTFEVVIDHLDFAGPTQQASAANTAATQPEPPANRATEKAPVQEINPLH